MYLTIKRSVKQTLASIFPYSLGTTEQV